MTVILSLHAPGPAPYPDWSNPNVWLINPSGVRNAPIHNQQNWCYASVVNSGTQTANATVSWYWCNFNIGNETWGQILANTAGYVSLSVPAGATVQAKSTAPWVPTVTGHTCLIAVAAASNDQPPPMGPTDPVLISDRHVGQQNQNVTLIAGKTGLITADFVVGAGVAPRQLSVERLPAGSLAGLDAHPALAAAAQAPELDVASAQVVRAAGKKKPDVVTTLGTRVMLAAPQTEELQLQIDVRDKPPPGAAALYQLSTTENGRTVGGAYILFVA